MVDCNYQFIRELKDDDDRVRDVADAAQGQWIVNHIDHFRVWISISHENNVGNDLWICI